jgi:hypothetical protein
MMVSLLVFYFVGSSCFLRTADFQFKILCSLHLLYLITFLYMYYVNWYVTCVHLSIEIMDVGVDVWYTSYKRCYILFL